MPQMLPPEAARFVVRDGAPTVALSVDVPADVITGEWSLINRLTLVVVDGPGDAGFLLPRLTPAGDAAPEGWDEAVDRAGGSHVAFGADAGAPTVFARNID
ncbi:hypothetical protein [Actinoplanes sp. NPDC049316]|uniref:hypothetical protein n=1 Tax=Actinoplanes sp. NPDC049316 TaxID=3154727 RepID=UPI00341FD3C2